MGSWLSSASYSKWIMRIYMLISNFLIKLCLSKSQTEKKINKLLLLYKRLKDGIKNSEQQSPVTCKVVYVQIGFLSISIVSLEKNLDKYKMWIILLFSRQSYFLKNTRIKTSFYIGYNFQSQSSKIVIFGRAFLTLASFIPLY